MTHAVCHPHYTSHVESTVLLCPPPRFNTEYVRRGVAPPPDRFCRQHDYTAFLGLTGRLARSAVQLLPGGWRPGAQRELDRDMAFVRREE